MVLAFERVSNNAYANAILIQPSHNQPCLIAQTLAGVDITEKHDKDIDFEFHKQLREATW